MSLARSSLSSFISPTTPPAVFKSLLAIYVELRYASCCRFKLTKSWLCLAAISLDVVGMPYISGVLFRLRILKKDYLVVDAVITSCWLMRFLLWPTLTALLVPGLISTAFNPWALTTEIKKVLEIKRNRYTYALLTCVGPWCCRAFDDGGRSSCQRLVAQVFRFHRTYCLAFLIFQFNFNFQNF